MKRSPSVIPSMGITDLFGRTHKKTHGGGEAIRNLFGDPAQAGLSDSLIKRRNSRKKNPMSPSMGGLKVDTY